MSNVTLTPKNQAPNMYVNWPDGGNYDLVMVDWYCEEAATNTYWAVHNWSGGYAGFQYSGGKYKILLSIWNDGTLLPEIEYVSAKGDTNDLDFGGEGEGKHIFTNYSWTPNKWYTMCIGTKTMNGKTYYAQWVREEGNADWFLAAIISFPKANRTLNKSSMFQEDFTFNKQLKRKCRLRRAYGRYAGTSNWHSWNDNTVTNSYFPYKETTWEDVERNVTVNCDWGTGSNNSYVWVQSGGNTPDNGKSAPPITYTLTQPSSPSNYPQWADTLPKYIKSKFSNLYVAPSGSNIVQNATKYYWNFKDSDDGYFHILTPDNTKAATLSGTSEGSNLTLVAYSNTNNNQKWNKQNAGNGLLHFIRPKASPTMTMDIEGPSTTSGANIQIWTFNSTPEQFKWDIFSDVEIHSIKSNFSNLYVSHSGTNVVQSTIQYEWNFVSCGDGYFYILTLDNTKAITTSGIGDGSNLILTTFNPSADTQKWKKESAGSGLYYFRPKSAPIMTMDVEGPSTSAGAIIQIWTYNSVPTQFKWSII